MYKGCPDCENIHDLSVSPQISMETYVIPWMSEEETEKFLAEMKALSQTTLNPATGLISGTPTAAGPL